MFYFGGKQATLPAMGRVEGKVALISGGARNIGGASARMLVAEGAQFGDGLGVGAVAEGLAQQLGEGAGVAAEGLELLGVVGDGLAHDVPHEVLAEPGDLLAGGAGDLDVDIGHQTRSPLATIRSISPIAPATRWRSESWASRSRR